MAAAFKLARQKGLRNHAAQLRANHARAEGKHVRVVVHTAHLGGIAVRAGAAANALHLVGRDGNADARAAAQNAALAFAAHHGLRRALGKHRVVAAVRGIGAIVVIGQLHLIQQRHDFLFQRQTGVVASQCNHDKYLLHTFKIEFLLQTAAKRNGRCRELSSLPGNWSHAPAVRESAWRKLETARSRRRLCTFPGLGRSPSRSQSRSEKKWESGSEALPDS